MFSENRIISGRQLKCITVLGLFAISLLTVPDIAVSVSKNAYIWSILAGTILSVILLMMTSKIIKNKKCSFYELTMQSVGKIWTKIFVIFLVSHLAVLAIYCIAKLADLVNLIMLSSVKNYIIALLFIIICCYGASNGMESIGRISEILIWAVLIIFGVISAFSVKGFEYKYVNIEWFGSWKDALVGSYGIYGILSLSSVYIIILNNISKHVKSKKRGVLISPLIFIAAINIILLVIMAGMFTVNGFADKKFPLIDFTTFAYIPGGFVGRLDSIAVSVLTASLFITTAFIIAIIEDIIKQSIKTKNIISEKKRFLTLIIGVCLVIAYGFTEIVKNVDKYFKIYFYYIGVPLFTLLIILLYIKSHKISGGNVNESKI